MGNFEACLEGVDISTEWRNVRVAAFRTGVDGLRGGLLDGERF